jgi:hypothetical protein
MRGGAPPFPVVFALWQRYREEKAQASGGSMEMALGLTHHGTLPKRFLNAGFPPNPVRLEREAIEVFGKNRNAATYRHWRNEGLTPTTDVRFDFESAFNEAVANAVNIHFNLDGINLRQA